MTARQCVIDTLNDDALDQVVPFTVANFKYTRDHFNQIRELVESDVIVPAPTGNREMARYHSLTNPPRMGLPFNDFAANPELTILQKSLIVHECIHAIQDYERVVWMRVETAEAAAYIGQMLFRFNRMAPPTGNEVNGILLCDAYNAARDIRRSPDSNLRYDQIGDLIASIRDVYPDHAITGRYEGIVTRTAN